MPRNCCQDRLNRALSQRLLLFPDSLKVVNEDEFRVTIVGTRGDLYRVFINATPECDCMDFQRRKSICKHILFVYHKLLHLDSDTITELNYPLQGRVLKAWILRLSERQNEPHESKRKDWKEQEECPICLEAFVESEQLLYCAKTCGTNFHKACLDRVRSQKCPMCRGSI